jgi:uncharacterized protein YcbX
MAMARLAQIYRYPVKGLSAEALAEVELSAGRGLPDDRRFAIARATAPLDPGSPRWLPKSNFFTLLSDERLAQLSIDFDGRDGKLVISRSGREVARANATDPMGRAMLSQFFASFLGPAAHGTPRFVEAGEQHFTDSSDPYLALVNLNSARDLERVARQPINPLRFRANLYLEEVEAWSEFAWVGQEFRLGDARLKVVEPIERCGATNVNPDTATRDINLPQVMKRGLGHTRLGLYLSVVEGGRIARGDALQSL